ncbi:hypothetical protein [Streptomyces sp. SPB074]|uniref:hypothetical protein n=1 Tax=Streptomyces sp. (strain SPB074) TaxID=465543 RepID=UPI00017F1065|nr:hypothetical protein [Streptomyces sp. SPB074]EDY43966.1 hypothetical protein SSBG_02156 [Streptomyces sp. SPB074]
MHTHFKRAAAAACGLIAALALTSCSGSAPATTSDAAPRKASGAPAATKEAPAASADVRIVKSGVEDHPTWGPGAYVVHYEITNHSTVAAGYFAQIEFLDADKDVLGTTGITADKLGAGKTSTGDTAPLDVEIRNGKMTDIRSVRVSEVDRTAS